MKMLGEPKVPRFFKGVDHLRPPNPRYNETWDPQIVLDYFLSAPENSELPLSILSKKLITLLLLLILNLHQNVINGSVAQLE